VTDLIIRRIPFKFDGVDFIWNPQNPGFSVLMNKVSFFAIGLEKYYCQAVKDAEPLISDAEVLEEAKAFRVQEGLHSYAHRQHVKALIERYPGLRGALDKIVQHFDTLYEERSLDYHLAYAGGLESIFTPSFKLLIDNREPLFGGGDARVASLFLWHFCEEIEHRSSALMIYDHVVGKYWYRVGSFPSFMKHVAAGLALLEEEFKKHVPEVPEAVYSADAYKGIPLGENLQALLGIVGAQMPWHRTENQKIPHYYHEWNGRYERGEDMTQVYGVPRAVPV
jgi:predicted metal-dependent hydrolase